MTTNAHESNCLALFAKINGFHPAAVRRTASIVRVCPPPERPGRSFSACLADVQQGVSHHIQICRSLGCKRRTPMIMEIESYAFGVQGGDDLEPPAVRVRPILGIVGRIWPNFGQVCPEANKFGRARPKSARIRPNDFGRTWPETEQRAWPAVGC